MIRLDDLFQTLYDIVKENRFAQKRQKAGDILQKW